MNGQLILTLLSGFIGAIGGSIITIGFTLWRDNKEEKRKIAREKLEKVYGPLVALKRKIDLRNRNENGFLLPSNPKEIEMLEKIMFHYYYLIDDELKDNVLLLHSDLRNDPGNLMRNSGIMDKIKKYYKENKMILGLK